MTILALLFVGFLLFSLSVALVGELLTVFIFLIMIAVVAGVVFVKNVIDYWCAK